MADNAEHQHSGSNKLNKNQSILISIVIIIIITLFIALLIWNYEIVVEAIGAAATFVEFIDALEDIIPILGFICPPFALIIVIVKKHILIRSTLILSAVILFGVFVAASIRQEPPVKGKIGIQPTATTEVIETPGMPNYSARIATEQVCPTIVCDGQRFEDAISNLNAEITFVPIARTIAGPSNQVQIQVSVSALLLVAGLNSASEQALLAMPSSDVCSLWVEKSAVESAMTTNIYSDLPLRADTDCN